MSYPLLIIVTYNSEAHLPTISDATAGWLALEPAGRVVIIENSASETTVSTLRSTLERYSDRIVIKRSLENIGFSPAVNDGYGNAVKAWGQPAAVILLNPDVSTDGATINALVRRLDDSKLGIVAPVLQDSVGKLDRGVARRRWNRRRLFAEVSGLPILTRVLATKSRYVCLDGNRPATSVDMTSGAFMAIRSEVFGTGLDTYLPMYLEDQEVCRTAHRLGYDVAVMHDLKATHSGGESRKTNEDKQRTLRMMELAEAPAISLQRWSNASRLSIRGTVCAAGVVRLILATLLRFIQTPGRSVGWYRDQMNLGRWFVLWSIQARSAARMTLG